MQNIDDAIDEWHDSSDSRTLHDFLGMTWEMYGKWLEGRMSEQELNDLGYYTGV